MDIRPQNPIDPTTVELDPRQDGGQAKPKSVWFDKKHVITYIIVLLALTVIGGAIYYYWTSLKPVGYSENCKNPNIFQVTAQDPKSNKIQTFPNCDSVPKNWEIIEIGSKETMQSSENSDWKTYTNSQYGFEFKYPSDWILSTQKPDDRFIISFTTKNYETRMVVAPQRKSQTTLTTWKEANPNGFFRDVKIGDQPGLELHLGTCQGSGDQTTCKYQVTFRSDQFFQRGLFFDLFIPIDSNLDSNFSYSQKTELYSIYKDVIDLEEGLLSTFKFTK